MVAGAISIVECLKKIDHSYTIEADGRQKFQSFELEFSDRFGEKKIESFYLKGKYRYETDKISHVTKRKKTKSEYKRDVEGYNISLNTLDGKYKTLFIATIEKFNGITVIH